MLRGYFPVVRLSFSFAGFFLLLIKIYKLCISPYLPPCCRFLPSCSAYAAEAVMKHGAFKGCILASVRLLRCQPFCKGGYDPVPENFSFKGLFTRKEIKNVAENKSDPEMTADQRKYAGECDG